MSRPQPPQPAKLVVGVFLQDKTLLTPVASRLEQRYGPLQMTSLWFDFDFTNYYAPEMGAPLYRCMLVFEELIEQEALADIKCYTNTIERSFTVDEKRRVNIDPGYLLYERFVLATGKNYSHRIYIGRNIYADLTLIYQAGGYQTLPWTYPDYARQEMRDFLLQVRRAYAADLARPATPKGI
jgi:hypothetical protein